MTVPSSSARRDAAALSVGTATSGLVAYAFVAIGTRLVGAEDFAPVSVLWSFWAVSAAAITFPVQHWIIRAVEATGSERAIWNALPRVWRMTGIASLVVLAIALSVSERLFGTSGWSFPAMTALLPACSVLMGINRGVLASRARFGSTAAAILGENLIRLLVVVAVGDRWASSGIGWALMAGFLVAAAFPGSFRGERHRDGTKTSLSLLGGLAGANAAAQTALTSGPIVLSLLGGSNSHVTMMFAVLAVLRAPYTVALGVTTRLTRPLTRLALADLATLRRWERRFLGFALAASVVAAFLGAIVIPPAVRLVFGIDPMLGGPGTIGVLTAASTLALASLVQMLVLLAKDRGRALSLSWVAGIAIGTGVLFTSGAPVLRVAVGFLAAETVAICLMAIASLRHHDDQELLRHASSSRHQDR